MIHAGFGFYSDTPSLTACHDGRDVSSFHQLWVID
jgi:hypothetical protein